MYNEQNDLTGYFSNELNVIRETRYTVPNKRYFFENGGKEGNYYIIYVKNGLFSFECNNTITELKYGNVVITRPFESFNIYTKHSSKTNIVEFSVVIISFHPSVFKNTKGDENYLRAFNDRKMGNFNVYNKEDFNSENVFEIIINQMSQYSRVNLGFYHFKSAVALLITQVSLAFDQMHNEEPVETTSEYKLKIYDYIKRNACNNISLEEVAKKYSVSSWYINNVTRKFYGKSFRKTIQSVRMFSAREMMSISNDLLEVSRLAGYSTYSGFYRNYINYFGISPRKDLMYYKKYGDYFNQYTSSETDEQNESSL